MISYIGYGIEIVCHTMLYLMLFHSNLSNFDCGKGIFVSIFLLVYQVEINSLCSISVNLVFWLHVINLAICDGVHFVGISR